MLPAFLMAVASLRRCACSIGYRAHEHTPGLIQGCQKAPLALRAVRRVHFDHGRESEVSSNVSSLRKLDGQWKEKKHTAMWHSRSATQPGLPALRGPLFDWARERSSAHLTFGAVPATNSSRSDPTLHPRVPFGLNTTTCFVVGRAACSGYSILPRFLSVRG